MIDSLYDEPVFDDNLNVVAVNKPSTAQIVAKLNEVVEYLNQLDEDAGGSVLEGQIKMEV